MNITFIIFCNIRLRHLRASWFSRKASLCKSRSSGFLTRYNTKPGCTITEDDLRLEISDLESRGITFRVAKTKAPASICHYIINKFFCSVVT